VDLVDEGDKVTDIESGKYDKKSKKDKRITI
jgi:hypothetical protein